MGKCFNLVVSRAFNNVYCLHSSKPKPKIDIPARPSWKKFNVKNFWIYHYTTTVKSSNGPSTGQLKVGSKAGDVRRNQCAWWKYMRAPKKN